MSAALIDGKAAAAALRARVAAEAARLKAETGVTPGLAVVLVGDDAASAVYVRNKGIAAREAGFHAPQFTLPAATTEAELLALVRRLNDDATVHGILVQFPVPPGIRQSAVIDAIDPAKDVDGLHPVNAGLLASGREGLVSCTPLGVMLLLRQTLPSLSGLSAIVIGRSILVGKPVAQLLTQADATVTLAHSKTKDLAGLCRTADIVVAAIGKPEFVRGEWIKPAATVIDVGINRVDLGGGKTKLLGDVAFAEASARAGAITPVPGGVGPMTIACLLRNTLVAACRQNGRTPPAGL